MQLFLGASLIFKTVQYFLLFDKISSNTPSSDSRIRLVLRGHLIFSGQFFMLLSTALFLCSLLLVSLGHSIMRQALALREKQILVAAFLCFMLFGILYSLCTDKLLCGAYVLTFQVVHFLVIFGIIIALNSNIERLRANIQQLWPSFHACLPKLQLYRRFRMVVVMVYLVLPILLMFMEATVLTWRGEWLKILWREALVMCIYTMVAYSLRPTLLITYHFFSQNPNELPLPPGVISTQNPFQIPEPSQ